jgi:hypothetical protein
VILKIKRSLTFVLKWEGQNESSFEEMKGAVEKQTSAAAEDLYIQKS